MPTKKHFSVVLSFYWFSKVSETQVLGPTQRNSQQSLLGPTWGSSKSKCMENTQPISGACDKISSFKACWQWCWSTTGGLFICIGSSKDGRHSKPVVRGTFLCSKSCAQETLIATWLEGAGSWQWLLEFLHRPVVCVHDRPIASQCHQLQAS